MIEEAGGILESGTKPNNKEGIMRNKCLTGIVCFVAVIGLLLTAESASAADKIVLGHPACLSGKYAKSGAQGSWGIKASLKWINEVKGGVNIGGKKVPIDYIAYDCESRKEGVTSLIERLVTVDKANAIIGAYSSGLTLTGAPVAEKFGKIYLSYMGASNRIFQQGYEYAICAISPGSDYQTGALEMIRHYAPKGKRLAFVFEDSEFARSVLLGAAAKAKELGFDIVFNRTYPGNVTDMTPLLSDMKATKPEFIVGGGHFPDGQLMARQLADLDINVEVFSLMVAATLPAFYKALGPKAEGVCGPAQWEFGAKYSPEAAKKAGIEWFGPTNEQWIEFAKGFSGGEDPDYHAAGGGVVPLVYAKAVEVANSVDSDKVREVFNKLHLMTFFGDFKIEPKTGLQTAHSMVTVQWQDGKKIIVWPPAAAVGKLCFPMPTFAERAKGIKAIPK